MNGHFFFLKGDQLSVKDFTILYRHEEEERPVPIHQVQALHMIGELTMTKRLFTVLNRHQVPMFFYSYYGQPMGYYAPQNHHRYGHVLIEQVRCYDDDERRLFIVQALFRAAFAHMIHVLTYYRKRLASEAIGLTIEKLKQKMKQVRELQTIDHFMMYEAAIRRQYYHHFDEILAHSTLKFERRTMRPPRNEVNAVMGFINYLLYSELTTLTLQTKLNIDIGFLHATVNRSQALIYDISELYKPILCDRTLFRILNRKMVQQHDFRRLDNGAVYLTEEAMKVVIHEFQQQLAQVVTVGKRRMSYRSIMLRDLYSLQNYITGKSDTFLPFILKG